MSIVEQIRKYIDSNGMRMNFVASRSEIKAKRFYRIINGLASMSVEEYVLVCTKGLSLNPSYFFVEKFSENENKTISA